MQVRCIRKLASIEPLVLEPLIEANVRDRDTEPGHEAKKLLIRVAKGKEVQIYPATDVMLANHWKTRPEPLLIPIKARRANMEQKKIAG